MKWQDTTPRWQAQPLAALDERLAGRNLSRSQADQTLQAVESSPAAVESRPAAVESRPAAIESAPAAVESTRVLIEPDAILAVGAHLGLAPHEQGGLLIGEVFADQSSSFILVSEAVASTEFDASSISLRMQSSVWSLARERLDGQRLIVGWYHSHPDLGAFFSGTDRRTQAAFFTHAYSLGWVIDPFRAEQAWYLGANSLALDPSQCEVLKVKEVR